MLNRKPIYFNKHKVIIGGRYVHRWSRRTSRTRRWSSVHWGP